MRLQIPAISILVCGVFFVVVALAPAQSVSNYAVQVSAVVQTNPPRVTLSWIADSGASDYTLFRKSRDSISWGAPIASLAGTAVTFPDSDVAMNTNYEYKISKSAAASGYGYIYMGIQAPLAEDRGKVILLVDNAFTSSLSGELARLQQDLIGDGWIVLRHDVSRSDSVTNIKALVSADYNADPANVKVVFLLGHVPVPYSGNINPDGHSEHLGAWPADVYYADMNGTWTDSNVNSTGASDPRNWNTPGDGKFDQGTLPSDLTLQVGRVDLANLPILSRTETELLRQYLNKNHNFRHRLIAAQRRAWIDDNFGVSGAGAPVAVSGWRNFPALFGASNTFAGSDWFMTMATNSYLWGYGCGAGTYTSIAGVGSTANFAANDPQVVFTMFFGSFFGDWDTTNNVMRAALATTNYTLTSVWSGRPYWQFHHMAMGETIGFSTKLSQNNNGVNKPGYDANNQYIRSVTIALMGDPTLRMHAVAPVSLLLAATNGSGGVDLTWNPSADAVVGYHVYRAPTATGPFTRLTANLLTATNFTDPVITTNVYMVRAVKLEVSGSGSYYNASQGIFQNLNNSFGPTVLTITNLNNGSFSIRGGGIPGQTYRIQFTDGPDQTNWQTLGTATASPAGIFQFTNSSATAQRFYRSIYP
jgi:hypothetical protein